MLVATDTDVDVPVDLTVLGASLAVSPARLVRMTSDHLHLLAPGVPAPPGARVIVTLGSRQRVTGCVVDHHAGGGLQITRDRTHTSDERGSPRILTDLKGRWGRLPQGADTQAWLGGGPDPSPLLQFTSPTDLSVGGVVLPCSDDVPQPGTRVMVELELGTPAPLRGVAIVRRHIGDVAPAIAVEFAEVADDAAERISGFLFEHL